jgi:hypothetical protein
MAAFDWAASIVRPQFFFRIGAPILAKNVRGVKE